MPTQVKYIALSGGLNLVDPHVTVPDSVMTQCLNFEQVFGVSGYRRINGYERFSGKLQPHEAIYYTVKFNTGSDELKAGDVIITSSATATVALVERSSGDWGAGAAEGTLVLTNMTGAIVSGQDISKAGVSCKAAASSQKENKTDAKYATYKAAAQAIRRNAILKVSGSGPILGVGIAKNVVYAARNADDGKTACLYKATLGGWELVRSGLYPNGSFRMIDATFSGDAAASYLYGVDGKNRPWKYDGTTFTFTDPIYGSQGTSTTSIGVETGSKTFTIVQDSRDWKAGKELIIWKTSDASVNMTGTVTSYSDKELVINITSVNGTGTHEDWEISLADFSDKPFDLIDHNDHMFLAYRRGQLQTSNLGDPMLYTSTAAVIGMSDEITGFTKLKGGLLAIYCTGKAEILVGSDKTSWKKEVNSVSSGAIFSTAQEIAGSGIALDIRGMTSLQATLNFGSFEMSVFSRMVKPYIDMIIPNVVGSSVVRSKNQYRIYTSAGKVVTATIMTANAVITPADVSITASDYQTGIACVSNGIVDGDDVVVFGTDNGFVMRDNVGSSFDGVAIESMFRTPFISFKLPSNKKRIRKISLDLSASQDVSIRFRQDFDYVNGYYEVGSEMTTIADGSEWESFSVSVPSIASAEANVSGVGKNMAVTFYHSSATDDPFIIQGINIQYSPFGLSR